MVELLIVGAIVYSIVAILCTIGFREVSDTASDQWCMLLGLAWPLVLIITVSYFVVAPIIPLRHI